MTITKDPSGSYNFSFDFDWGAVKICQDIKAEVGVKSFYFKNQAWWFNDPALVSRLKEAFPSVVVAPEVESDLLARSAWAEGEARRIETAMRLRDALTTDFVTKNVKRPLYKYQDVAVQMCLNNHGRLYIADEPGCGKCSEALGYVAHAGIEKVVIICPASIKSVWEKETREVTKLKPYAVGKGSPLDIENWNSHDVIILNYAGMKKHLDFLKAVKIECLIGDESHAIKNPQSQQSKAFTLISKGVPHVLLLSGTPVLNRPVELFQALHVLNPSEWSDYWAYCRRYCGAVKTRFGWDVSKATNQEELRARIAPYFLRREKEKVLAQLPPRVYQDIEVELDPASRRAYDEIEDGAFDGDTASAIVQLGKLRQTAAMGKIEAVTEFISDRIESEKVILFCSYVEPLRQVAEFFGDKAVMLTGKTPQEERGEIVRRFQEDDSVRVFLGGTLSASEGITLHAARTTIFLDRPWTAAAVSQAASRNHRPGVKHESLSVVFMMAKSSIDEKMKWVIEAKKKVFEKLFVEGASGSEEQAMFKELIASYKEDALKRKALDKVT